MNSNAEQQTSNQPKIAGPIRFLAIIVIVGICLGIAFFGVAYWQYNLLQFAAMCIGLAVSLLVVLFAAFLYRANHRTSGEVTLLGGLLIPYVLADFLGEGITLFVAVGGNLLILIFNRFVFQKNKWIGWLFFVILIGLTVFNATISPVPRYPIATYPFLWWFMLAAIGVIAAVALFLGLQSLQYASLRARLVIAFVMLVVVPMALLSLASITLAQENSREQARSELNGLSARTTAQIEAWFRSLNSNLVVEVERSAETGNLVTLLNSADNSPEYTAAYQGLVKRFVDTIRLRKVFEELFVLDRRGTTVLSTNSQQEGKLNFNQDYFRSGLNGPFIIAERTESLMNPINVIISLPIVTQDGRTLGVIAGRTGMQNIRSLIENANLSGSDEMFLVGEDQALLTPLKAEGAPTLGMPIPSEGVTTALVEQDRGLIAYPNTQGEPVYGYYTWLPSLQAVLLVERNASDVNQAANGIALINGSLAVVMVILAVIAGLLAARAISRPLMELDQTAQKIASGTTHLRAPVTSQDEIGRLAASFNRMTDQLADSIEGLEARVLQRTQDVERRSKQIAAAAEIGSSIASMTQINTLLTQVTHLISDKFGFYHAGIFLIDDNSEYAVLRAANSEGGKRMLARNHRLAVGHTGIVGYVTAKREARIALDVGQDAVFFNNPDLPETRSEMALPLVARGELLGALDVQSTEAAAFTPDDVEVLQLVADQLAVAIQNAQLFTKTQEALETARTAYGEFGRKAWNELMQGKPALGFHSAEQHTEPVSAAWTPEMQEALRTGNLVRGNGNTHSLAIPIKIRDTIIGVVDTYKPLESGDWTNEELAALDMISSQLGIALESARLYEETQFQAETERLLGEITSHVRETLDIDYVLQTAAQDILEALELSEVEIRLNPMAEQD